VIPRAADRDVLTRCARGSFLNFLLALVLMACGLQMGVAQQ